MSNPYILVEDFRAGLDTRRMNITSPPGTLQVLSNAHINRGGEVEKAQAFQKIKDLEEGKTFGVVESPSGFFVFGSDDLSSTYTNNVINSNPPIRYQRLNDGPAVMSGVLSAELFDGKPYVIAEYSDGVIRHFYDGTKIPDWSIDKARAKFTISGGVADDGSEASGSFKLSNGFVGDDVNQVTVGGVNLMSSPVELVAGEDIQDVISKVVNEINDNSLSSGYEATFSGNRITVEATTIGTAQNGKTISVTATGSITVSDINNTSGGTNPSQITDVTVDSTSVIDTKIDWLGSNSQTARAVSSAIRNYSSTSGFTSISIGQTVFIISETAGTADNSKAVVVTASGSLSITPNSGIVLQNGSATTAVYDPGRFAKTVRTKMYVLSGSVMHYSAVADATAFSSGTGSGFDNLSTNTSGSEQLVGMANYFENIVIFSKNNAHVWSVDPDPAKNIEVQVLNNTGSISPKSIIEFGDNDVFYLSQSGIRSLRARDSSNAAFVNDVGVAIDSLIQKEIQEKELKAVNSAGVLEPRDSRYMLALGEKIYVFSFFSTSDVSAWSTYEPGFEVTDWAFSSDTILARSGDTIYQYGKQANPVYDNSEMTMVLPYLNASDPASIKTWTAIDIACEGTFEVYVSTNPKTEIYQLAATIVNTTYSQEKVPLAGRSTHISIKLVSKNDGFAKVGNMAIHYSKGASQ